jgi:hypothetical protein
MTEALEVGTRLLQLAEDMVRTGTDAPGFRMTNFAIMAHHALGYSHFYRGEFADTCRVAEAGLALQRLPGGGEFALEAERELVRAFQFSSSAALRMMLGCSQWMLGHPSRGRALVADSIALTRALDHFPSEAYALASSLLLHHCDLDVDSTAAAAQRLRTLAQQERFEIWTPFADMFDGWVTAERGLTAAGIAETTRGLDEWRRTGSILNQTIVTAMLARSLRKAGLVDEALARLEEEIVESDRRKELLFAPELYRLKGDMLAERGHTSEALRALEQAAAMAAAQGAAMLEVRALSSMLRVRGPFDKGSVVSTLATVLRKLDADAWPVDTQEAMDTLITQGAPPAAGEPGQA